LINQIFLDSFLPPPPNNIVVDIATAGAAFFIPELHKHLNYNQSVTRRIIIVLGFTSYFTICHFMLEMIHWPEPMSFSCTMLCIGQVFFSYLEDTSLTFVSGRERKRVNE
jgi:hypothetical protein